MNNHAQHVLNVFVNGTLIGTVYNRAEAARLLASRGRWKDAQCVFSSAISAGFRNGGTVAELPFGFRVVKTEDLAPCRSMQSEALQRKRKQLRKREKREIVTVVRGSEPGSYVIKTGCVPERDWDGESESEPIERDAWGTMRRLEDMLSEDDYVLRVHSNIRKELWEGYYSTPFDPTVDLFQPCRAE